MYSILLLLKNATYRGVEDVIKRAIPETYAVVEKILTEFGEMPTLKRKGEGGSSSLAKRIADNFHNKFLRFVIFLSESLFGCLMFREEITHPTSSTSNKPQEDLLDLSGGKKTRKFYCIVPERWNLAEKMTKEEFLENEKEYLKIAGEEDIDLKKIIIDKSKPYLQSQFRTLEIVDHVYKHKDLWQQPHGPVLISFYFEWLTGGSGEHWLGASIDKNLEPVLAVVSEIILNKKGELWGNKLEEVNNNAVLQTGNDSLLYIFLLREWSKLYKEKPHRVIFVEDEDSTQDVSKTPYVHVRKISQAGEDYEKKVIVSVMSGGRMIFEAGSNLGIY